MTNKLMLSALIGIAALSASAASAQTASETRAIQYRCMNGRAIGVTYRFQPPRSYVVIRDRGRNYRLNWVDTGDDMDTTFKGGGYTWSIPGMNASNVTRANGGSLMRKGYAWVNNRRVPVDQFLYKDCTPRRR